MTVSKSKNRMRGRRSRALTPAWGMCLALAAGCGDEFGGDADGFATTNPKTGDSAEFEAYAARALTMVKGRQVYIVEEDMLFDSREKLLDYYIVHNGRPGALIVNTAGGDRDIRANPLNIQYCYSDGWGNTPYSNNTLSPTLDGVQAAVEVAMRAWEGVARVRFVHRADLDGAGCNTDGANPGVDFVVTHWDSPCTAIGPFPSNAFANQRLLVPVCGLPGFLAHHEVGHALGFRHEHIHSDADPRCNETGTSEELTEFDTDSTMKYADCTVNSIIANVPVSRLDGIGSRIAYGEPDWWWPVLP